MYTLFTHRDFVLQSMNILPSEGDTHQEKLYTWVPWVNVGHFIDAKNKSTKSNYLMWKFRICYFWANEAQRINPHELLGLLIGTVLSEC